MVSSASWASTYFVGNSLTLDGLGHYSAAGLGMELLADSAGVALDYGFHIRCSSSLPDTLANPTETCVVSPFQYGTFSNALPNYKWDKVSLQPYEGTTLGNDAAACGTFIDLSQSHPGNDDTAFYIYSAWPALTVGKFSDFWTGQLADDDATPSQQQRSYVDHLFNRVDSANDATLRLVPAGEVFYRLDLLIDAGQLPGVTSFAEFYRDDLHLSKLGTYVASSTILAATERENPANFSVPALNYGVIPNATLAVLQKTIWDVIVSEPRTGLADFNDDGIIGDGDLDLWTARDPRADANGDDIVDGADFLLWQRQFSAASSALASVPEPASSSLTLFALVLTRFALRPRRHC
ncbi:MAG: hypothetical protein C0485_15460 [Pirellula sp.]|nr:hypothetical protein [Pirellula sp.]